MFKIIFNLSKISFNVIFMPFFNNYHLLKLDFRQIFLLLKENFLHLYC